MRALTKPNRSFAVGTEGRVMIPCRACRARVSVSLENLKKLWAMKCPFCKAVMAGPKRRGRDFPI